MFEDNANYSIEILLIWPLVLRMSEYIEQNVASTCDYVDSISFGIV